MTDFDERDYIVTGPVRILARRYTHPTPCEIIDEKYNAINGWFDVGASKYGAYMRDGSLFTALAESKQETIDKVFAGGSTYSVALLWVKELDPVIHSYILWRGLYIPFEGRSGEAQAVPLQFKDVEKEV